MHLLHFALLELSSDANHKLCNISLRFLTYVIQFAALWSQITHGCYNNKTPSHYLITRLISSIVETDNFSCNKDHL